MDNKLGDLRKHEISKTETTGETKTGPHSNRERAPTWRSLQSQEKNSQPKKKTRLGFQNQELHRRQGRQSRYKDR